MENYHYIEKYLKLTHKPTTVQVQPDNSFNKMDPTGNPKGHENESHRNADGSIPENHLYSCMKPVIFLGRLTFTIPCSRKNCSSYKRPTLSFKLLPSLATVIVIGVICVQVICDTAALLETGSKGKFGVMNYVLNLHYLFYSLMSLTVYSHFLMNADKFYKIFEKWEELKLATDFVKDRWLSPLSWVLILVLAILAMIAYTVFHVDTISHIKTLPNYNNLSVLEVVYKISSCKALFPYNPVLTVIMTMCKLLGIAAVTYVSILIVVFSRAVSFQFRKLIETAIELEVGDIHFADLQSRDKIFWQDIVSKYRRLYLLLKAMSKFLSPLVFAWVTYNIYMISVQLLMTMTSKDTKDKGGRMPKQKHFYSLLIQTLRFVIALFSATKVNTYAVKILGVLRRCPKEHYYDAEVHRLEYQISTETGVGFKGLGCFTITRPFLLTIFNAIFTFVIVLLQSIQAP